MLVKGATGAYFDKEVTPSLAKPPLNFNSGLAEPGLTSLVKYATGGLLN